MSERKQSQRGFVAVTLITVLAIALVLLTYASLLGMFKGGEVTVGSITADVWYSTTNSSPWTENLYNVSASWYAMANFTSDYNATVKITWQLEREYSGTYSNYSTPVITTSYAISQGVEVYASSDGSIGSNQDWSSKADDNGTYRVVAYVESIG